MRTGREFNDSRTAYVQLFPKPLRNRGVFHLNECDVIVSNKVFRVFDDPKMGMRSARSNLMQESLHRVAVEIVAE